jgi:DNA-binding GntR family transcriptional regulator
MEGYVDALSNRGAFVKRVSVRDVEEIYDILAILEGYATEIVTMYIGTAAKEELGSMHKEMKSIYKDIRNDLKKQSLIRSYKKWFEKNASFHSYFVKANGNLHLSEMINSLRDRTYRYRFIAISIPNQIEAYVRAHDEIVKAVFKGRGKQAGEAMRRHVFYVKKILIKSLEESPWLL